MIAPGLLFSDAKDNGEIYTVSPHMGATNASGVG